MSRKGNSLPQGFGRGNICLTFLWEEASFRARNEGGIHEWEDLERNAGSGICVEPRFPGGFATSRKTDPAITESFASGEVSPGQTWKVYLKVSDPQGEIANIYATVEQPGVGTYPLSIIKVKEGNRKELSGYIYLSTSNPVASLDSVNLTLTVQVQDSSGNLSRPAVFPLSINNRFNQKAAPPGIFQEKEIGPIMVTLRTILPNKG